MIIGETVEHIKQQINDFDKCYKAAISIYDSKIHIWSEYYPAKDSRLDFTSDKGYSGMLDLSSEASQLYMIPVSVVVK